MEISRRYNDLKVKLKLKNIGRNHPYTDHTRGMLFEYGNKKFFARRYYEGEIFEATGQFKRVE